MGCKEGFTDYSSPVQSVVKSEGDGGSSCRPHQRSGPIPPTEPDRTPRRFGGLGETQTRDCADFGKYYSIGEKRHRQPVTHVTGVPMCNSSLCDGRTATQTPALLSERHRHRNFFQDKYISPYLQSQSVLTRSDA